MTGGEEDRRCRQKETMLVNYFFFSYCYCSPCFGRMWITEHISCYLLTWQSIAPILKDKLAFHLPSLPFFFRLYGKEEYKHVGLRSNKKWMQVTCEPEARDKIGLSSLRRSKFNMTTTCWSFPFFFTPVSVRSVFHPRESKKGRQMRWLQTGWPVRGSQDGAAWEREE